MSDETRTEQAELMIDFWREIANAEDTGKNLNLSRTTLRTLIDAHDHLMDVWRS